MHFKIFTLLALVATMPAFGISLESSIQTALANNPNGMPEGAWVPFLLVRYEIVKHGGGDKISGFQRLHGTERDVLAVADRGWNDAQHGERDRVYQPSVRRVVRFSAKSAAALERP